MKVSSELILILENLLSENKNVNQWAEVESSDMFQTENYCGGFDATENAFCFSYFDDKNNEFWFQITLEEVKAILAKNIEEINIRKAE